SDYMKRYMYGLLLVPLFAGVVWRTELYPLLQFDYMYTAIWGSVFWLASLSLAVIGILREHHREKIVYHLAIALILLSNGFILVLSHFHGKEFIEFVNMNLFSAFLGLCLLLLIWVNMRKMLVGMQRQAVVQKLDMSTAL